MTNKKILIIACTLIFLIGCKKDANNAINADSINNIFITKYIKLIEGYKRKDIDKILNVDKIFQKITSIPVKNYIITADYKLVKKFFINNTSGLPEYGIYSFPKILDFPRLKYIYKNSDMLFTGVSWDKPYHSTLYKQSTGEIIRNESIDKLFIHNNPEKIFINSKWEKLTYNEEKRSYYINEEKIIDYADFPIYLASSKIIAPIKTEKSLWKSTLTTLFVNNIQEREYIFFIYDWKQKKVVKEKILPFTSEYLRFDLGLGETDSQDRVYFRFWADAKRKYEGMTQGHIMIYDINKDTMYNIRHPFFDENNKGEEFLETQYILGEDENICYQLVTDKAYYVYKIEPLWNEPMEETDYNPVFFEMHPDLKKEWDKLSEKEMTK